MRRTSRIFFATLIAAGRSRWCVRAGPGAMQVQAGRDGSRRGRAIPLVGAFLAGVIGGRILEQDDRTDDRTPAWSGVVHVGGESVAAELIPKGDYELPYGYELCVTPAGAPRGRCVSVTDSNDIDARLESTSVLDLLIVLSGSDRPLDLPDGVEVPFGSRRIQGVLVAVDMADDCVSFSVPDPTGGTSQMIVQRTIYETQGETVSWSLEPASAVGYDDNDESCLRLT